MPAPRIPLKERERRLEKGRLIRLEMERRNVSYDDLITRFKKSRQSIYLALRTPHLPTLRSQIEHFVLNKKRVPVRASES